ncbi:MAG: hypothetical protein F6K23_13855 [Okeania sp. SIO2C9]|uniref:hypothetical protein n=1 Tax=Okeania sp. SIO2C9 TaxID=2607791 RepID=UPI0013C0AE6A|nr:hypothetical protein [Okeania sp. SIO2C9]NEQ74028.1 hypothetical protein [Okeania sp. SIO2C9]
MLVCEEQRLQHHRNFVAFSWLVKKLVEYEDVEMCSLFGVGEWFSQKHTIKNKENTA